MTAPDQDPWTAALQAEHVAIFGYGVLGAFLDDPGKAAARLAEAAHRDRRDAATTIAAAIGTPPPAAPAYSLDIPVRDRASALELAIALEDGAALAWRLALGHTTTGDDRQLALDALTASAVQATRWRLTAGITPATVAFPGTPD